MSFENKSNQPEKSDGAAAWYQEVLMYLQQAIGFDPTPAEATYLRQLAEECLLEDAKSEKDGIDTFNEILERFFWNYYGVNLSDMPKAISSKSPEENSKIFLEYIKKLRKDKELI